LDVQNLGFDHIKELYKDDLDFSHIYQEFSKGGHKYFFIHDGFLFKRKRFCVPQGSLRQSLVREAHEGGLMGHFGVVKTLDTLHEHVGRLSLKCNPMVYIPLSPSRTCLG